MIKTRFIIITGIIGIWIVIAVNAAVGIIAVGIVKVVHRILIESRIVGISIGGT